MNDERLPELHGELGLSTEEGELRLARCVVPVVVESRLADGDRLRMGEKSPQLGEVALVALPRVVRVQAEGCVDALLGLADGERLATRADVRPHRDDAGDPGFARAGEHSRDIAVAGVEVRVRVDQAAAVDSTRGKSGVAGSIPSAAAAPPGLIPSHDTSAGCPSAARIRSAVSGT